MKINTTTNYGTASIIKVFGKILLLGMFAVSCSRQDPIFYIISTETALQPPLIEGAPTNMVKFEREYTLYPYDQHNPFLVDPDDPDNHTIRIPILYVASGRLHWYAPTITLEPEWDLEEYPIKQPEGNIIGLTATSERLYALCLDSKSVNTTLRYIGHSEDDWKQIDPVANNYPLIQSIYADPATERLFVSARKKDNASYAILYLDDATDTLKMLKDETAILSGIACQGDTYYLCTKGSGIIRVNEDAAHNITASNIGDNLIFMGMIKLKDASSTIIVVERNGGALYKIDNGSLVRMYYDNGDSIATGKYATGALALWEDPDRRIKMLIAAIQGGLHSSSTTSFTHGYVEFDLNYSDDSLNTNSTRHDSGKLQSVSDNNRYTASIGKRPINHLFQAPPEIDPNMTFFASTQTAGLWSYRDRPDNGGPQWNAEKKGE